jgi:hypothetical protein
MLTAMVTFTAIFATTTSFGDASAYNPYNEYEIDQYNNQICIFSDCLQINQENDQGNNDISGGINVGSNDGIEEEEVLPDTQTLIATPY